MHPDVPLLAVIGGIVSHTPLYVWAILGALIAAGSLQWRTLRTTRSRLLAAPIALGAFALWGVSNAFGLHPTVLGAWLLGLAASLVLNRVLLHWPGQIRMDGDAYVIAGSPWPLILMLATFMLRYAVAVTLVLHPDWRADPAFAAEMALLYGALSGLFTARAVRILTSGPRARLAAA